MQHDSIRQSMNGARTARATLWHGSRDSHGVCAFVACAFAAIGVMLASCSAKDTDASCGIPGRVGSCVCPAGGSGVQTCQTNGEWTTCQCAAGSSNAGAAGAAGSSGVAGSSAGAAGSAGSAAGGASGAAGVAAGSGGTDAAGAAGAAGTMELDAGPPMPTKVYMHCMNDGDCGAGGELTCYKATGAGIFGGGNATGYCSPKCQTTADCPKTMPGQAMPTCSQQACTLACSIAATCPNDLTCSGGAFGGTCF